MLFFLDVALPDLLGLAHVARDLGMNYTFPMSVRLKSLTALTLAVLYGLVGFTGVSLHYLVDEFCLTALDDQALGSSGYLHSHQPDNHLHFHHHHHHGGTQVESSTAQPGDVQPGDNENQAATKLNRNEQFHSPHACPLLTIISQLKVGQGGWVAICIDPDASHASSCHVKLCHAYGFASLARARGPPVTSLLA